MRRLSLLSEVETILTDHDYTYFGAQSHGLHSRYSRLHTPRYRNARGFTTDLLGLSFGLIGIALPILLPAHRLGNINEFQNLLCLFPRFGFILARATACYDLFWFHIYFPIEILKDVPISPTIGLASGLQDGSD